jgi:hypothetical protein
MQYKHTHMQFNAVQRTPGSVMYLLAPLAGLWQQDCAEHAHHRQALHGVRLGEALLQQRQHARVLHAHIGDTGQRPRSVRMPSMDTSASGSWYRFSSSLCSSADISCDSNGTMRCRQMTQPCMDLQVAPQDVRRLMPCPRQQTRLLMPGMLQHEQLLI